jgi:hypothetical protein
MMNKFEIRNPKHETISKFEFLNVQKRFDHLEIVHLDLFRISIFDIRIFNN